MNNLKNEYSYSLFMNTPLFMKSLAEKALLEKEAKMKLVWETSGVGFKPFSKL